MKPLKTVLTTEFRIRWYNNKIITEMTNDL